MNFVAIMIACLWGYWVGWNHGIEEFKPADFDPEKEAKK